MIRPFCQVFTGIPEKVIMAEGSHNTGVATWQQRRKRQERGRGVPLSVYGAYLY